MVCKRGFISGKTRGLVVSISVRLVLCMWDPYFRIASYLRQRSWRYVITDYHSVPSPPLSEQAPGSRFPSRITSRRSPVIFMICPSSVREYYTTPQNLDS